MSDLNVKASFREKPVLDDDDTGSVTKNVPNNTEYSAPIIIAQLTTRAGRRCRIIGLHQAWDSSIDGFVSWALFVGGRMHYKYPWTTGQIASPGQGQVDLPSEVIVAGSTEISIRAVLPAAVGAPNGGLVTARIRCIYEAF